MNPKLAKDIVAKTMAILGNNTNIMDTDAIILASGDPSRLGTYHEGAHKVITSGKPFEVYSWDASALKGVQPGISLPIMYRDKVAGVIGITGDPYEIRKYGELVRSMAELMLGQASLREEIYLQSRAKDTYFQDLLAGQTDSDSEVFYQRGHLLGLNLDIARVAIDLDMRGIISDSLAPGSGYDDVLGQQRIRDELIRQLRTEFREEAGVEIGLVGTTSIAILAPISQDMAWREQRKALSRVADRVSSVVSRRITGAHCLGIGEYHPGWIGLRDSYQEAVAAVDLAKTFAPESTVFFIRDGFVEYCLTRVPSHTRQRQCRQILGDLIVDVNPYKRELLDTLEVFVKEDLNTAKTAERLFMHRNTVTFRLKKIEEITGLNAYHYSDAVRLQVALMLWQCERES